ncbi:MAG: 3-hydroxyacyl-ACP dehydratase FabZ [Chloroflexaceae bacterium]|nr:3-hydroxyacyl-ACP dehydratase FabZ [Chloroflexaceae bacterium]
MMNVEQIMAVIPHRYPFLLIDRIVELEPGVRAVAIKQVTINEPFFQGHFPDYPIMPGVLIIEALAQTGAVAGMVLPENKGKIALFAGIEGARFRRPVVPGDSLRLEVTIEAMKRGIGKAAAKATVDGNLACEAQLTFALVARTNS